MIQEILTDFLLRATFQEVKLKRGIVGLCYMHPPLSSQNRIRAAELFEQYSIRLMDILRIANPTVDQDDVSDAIIDAILTVTAKDTQEDEQKGKFLSLLRRMAQNRLIDRIRKRQRRQQRELKKIADSVTNPSAVSKEVDDADDGANTGKLAARYTSELATNDDERKYLQLWLENKKHESIIDGFCTAQKTREQATTLVKQLSDRMRQRMNRLRKRLAEEEKP